MTESDIRETLDNHLLGMPPGVDVAWPNTAYVPTKGTPFLRPTLLPSDVTQAELGSEARNEFIGLYQVDVFYPAGQGRGSAEAKANEIIARFNRGDIIERYNPDGEIEWDFETNTETITQLLIQVRIDKARTLSARSETPWFILPVQIDYRAYMQHQPNASFIF